MKKKVIGIILLFLFALSLSFIYAYNQSDIITGGASSQLTQVSIYVLPIPVLTLISPENETYLTNLSLLLNFTSVNTDTTWYNIDNGTNITVTGAVYFNTSQGQHTLYLFANNTGGYYTTKNVTFTANSSFLRIYYEEYNGSNKGNSTNFSEYTYEDLSNLSNLTLENILHGKIRFTLPVNITNDYNPSDGIVDLDSYTNISSNRIEINSTALPNFNVAAIFSLYGLTFSNPRILKDNVVCSECTKLSYSGGILLFSTTSTGGVYTAEETPSTGTTTGTGGGGGGGGGGGTTGEILISPSTISLSLKQGETKEKEIVLENTGRTRKTVEIEIESIEDMVKPNVTELIIEGGEKAVIRLDIIARENLPADVYIGKIKIRADGVEQEVLIAIEIETKKSLFDIKLKIPPEYQHVFPGEEFLYNVEIYNLGERKRVDIGLEYFIKDPDNNTLLYDEESIAIETSLSFIKTFFIPVETKPGKYLVYVKLTHGEEVVSASSWFTVKSRSYRNNIIIIIGIILIVGLIILFLKRKKKDDEKEKIAYKTDKKKRLQPF